MVIQAWRGFAVIHRTDGMSSLILIVRSCCRGRSSTLHAHRQSFESSAKCCMKSNYSLLQFPVLALV